MMKYYTGDVDKYNGYLRGTFSRVLIYVSKFIPFLIVILVQNIIAFFATRKQDEAAKIEDDATDDELKSEFNP